MVCNVIITSLPAGRRYGHGRVQRSRPRGASARLPRWRRTRRLSRRSSAWRRRRPRSSHGGRHGLPQQAPTGHVSGAPAGDGRTEQRITTRQEGGDRRRPSPRPAGRRRRERYTGQESGERRGTLRRHGSARVYVEEHKMKRRVCELMEGVPRNGGICERVCERASASGSLYTRLSAFLWSCLDVVRVFRMDVSECPRMCLCGPVFHRCERDFR